VSETALVTGGGGFLGRHVVRQLLARGDAVRTFGRYRYPALEALGAECHTGDLGDPGDALADAVKGVDVVHHVAAVAGVWGDPAAFHRTNVIGTEHVIAACRRAGVGRLVFTSTPSVVAAPDGTSHEGGDESLPYPATYLADYPRTKAQAERAVLAADGPGLRTTALRPHLIFGPGDPHLVPRVLERARSRSLRPVGDGSARVDLTFVENAARAHFQAAAALEGQAPAAGKAYFISQGEPVELWPWVSALLRQVGLPPLGRPVSFEAAFRMGAALEKAWSWLHLDGEPPMTRFVATQLATSHWFDISAARRDLGYDPEVVPMAEATQRLYAHYREGPGRWELPPE